ncbi:cytochrome b/b6 domain-containing protein [Sulfitobacter sp. LCG007]
MTLVNTASRYGIVARCFHWLVALLILTQIPLGLVAEQMPYETAGQLALKAEVFSLHKTLGVAIFLVALLRILWAITQPKPAPLHPARRVETWLADTVHWLLYISLVLVPLTGWIGHAAASGFAPILWPFGQSLPFVPKSEALAAAAESLHGLFAWTLVGALALHVAGALKHAVMDRDATLARMWSGSDAGTPATAPQHRAAPAIAAIVVWLCVIAAGLLAAPTATQRAALPALAQVQSDWQVQEGSITITVDQFGSQVSGSFADWTADISFDPEPTAETMGHVVATISVGSLSLGSVTSQALGADFLNAEGYPTATFAGDIYAQGDAYEARGTLTIRDAAVPATLPFDLDMNGDTAAMTGALTLDRRDFGIGNSLPDEQTLKFPVRVDVALTATRAAP